MKKHFGILLLLLLTLGTFLSGCSDEKSAATDKPKQEEKVKEKPKEEKTKEKKPEIDTSVFVYAEKVDITDARDITQHIDIVVHMNKEIKPGLATQHVITQAYDLVQQKDIEGANTITIGIMQGDLRIAQFTVDKNKFTAGENLIDSVLQASTIDKMSDEVKEYGKVMGLWE